MKKYKIIKSEVIGNKLIEEQKRMAQEVSFFDQIKSVYKVIPKPDTLPTTKITKIEYAMYYHYLIKAGIRAAIGFEKGELGKIDALEKIASQHGFTSKSFQIAFNKIDNDYKQKWITGTDQNLKKMAIVIEMLAEYPKAQLLAQNDLKQALTKGDKRGNPVR